MAIITLFHGSPHESVTPEYGLGNDKHDYGRGFYLTANVELAKEWRTDRALRHLEAMMIVADKDTTLILSGNGDVIEPEHGIAAIGSGGAYAQSAARALMEHTEMSAEAIARASLTIAGDLCIYTNHNLTVETVGEAPEAKKA